MRRVHGSYAQCADCIGLRQPAWCRPMTATCKASTQTIENAARSRSHQGVLLALGAFGLWSFYALFFKLLGHINPVEVTVHRGFWSLPVAGLVLVALGRTSDIGRALTNPKIMALLVVTAGLLTINWGFFVWAISQERTIEASLGYFINPLLNVLIGYVLLGERFNMAQAIAIALAVAAVLIQTFVVGVFPWLALLLGTSFALYGYLRKIVAIGPAQGFLIEAMLMSIGGIFVLIWQADPGQLRFAANWNDTLLLMACGPMTAGPLMLFSAAARRIRLSTLGLMQYIAPSGIFLTAVFVFKEPIDFWRWVSFALIWTALVIYSLSALYQDKRMAARRPSHHIAK